MNGLELSEKYYQEYGVPLIEQKFGNYKNKIAAGLVGEGSQCYGFDDEFSRDHDWGPEFCLWLNKQDYAAIGLNLQEEISNLTADFRGTGPRKVTEWGTGRVGVFEIGGFYKRFIGLDRLPVTLKEWRAIPEISLSAATNGKVFSDPLGEFTAFRDGLIAYYPEDIRLKKIASRCMSIAQLGQYNYIRCVRRKEIVAAQYIEAQFFANVISLIFLLNRQYMPFYKWMHRALKKLPILGEAVYKLLEEIAASYGFLKKNRLIEETCAVVIEELRREGLSDSPSDYFLDHGPIIQSRIHDIEIRNIDVRRE